MAQQYEYTHIQMAAGGRAAHLNERIHDLAAQGWEPYLMSGSETVNVMMRRPVQAAAQPQAQPAQQAAAAPRPAQPAQPAAPAPQQQQRPQQ